MFFEVLSVQDSIAGKFQGLINSLISPYATWICGMAYWLYTTNSNNWEVTKRTNILGVSEKHINSISRLQIGDICLVYVISERINGDVIGSYIKAAYEVSSNLFKNNSKIFQARASDPSERYSLRLRLKPLKIFKNPIPFKPLVQRLSFIKSKQRWSLHIRGKTLIEIPKDDYILITEAS